MAGAHTKYRPEYAQQAENYSLLGATDKDLATFFEVTESTINEWKKKYPAFSESLKRGKMIADMEVTQRLFTRAKGYAYTETTRERGKDGKMRVVKEVNKQVAPDTVACIYWLNNRQKDKWRNKIDHGIELPDEIVVKRPIDPDEENAG